MKYLIILLYATGFCYILPCSAQPTHQTDCLNISDKALINSYWKIYTENIPSSKRDYELAKIWLRDNLLEAEHQNQVKPQLYFLLAVAHLHTKNQEKAEENFKRVQSIFSLREVKPRIYRIARNCLIQSKYLNAYLKENVSLHDSTVHKNLSLNGFNTGFLRVRNIKERYLLMHFWASWCKPCISELPKFQAFFENQTDLSGNAFKIITINNDFSRASLERFTKEAKYTFPIYFDPFLKANDQLGIGEGLPQTIVVDLAEMKIVKRWAGGQNWNNPTFLRELQTILK